MWGELLDISAAYSTALNSSIVPFPWTVLTMLCGYVLGIKPPLVGWTTKAISFMNHLVKDKVLKIKVVDKDDSRSVVELVDVSVTPAINISSYLKEEDSADEKCRMAVPAIRMANVTLANGE